MDTTAGTMVHTLSVALALGVGLVILARKSGVSLIVFLLIGGLLAGPEGLKLINPASLGHTLEVIVAISVAVILFEGGMTLDVRGYRQASVVIRRLLTIGVAITWLTVTAVIGGLFGFRLEFCFLASSLVIVTGPTVVLPLLRRIRVRQDLHHILHWEAVLIDPIGVFIAVLCFELVDPAQGQFLVVGKFLFRFVVGLGLGVFMGFAADFLLRRAALPDESVTIFALAVAILTYGLCDMLVPESGLLGAVVAGFVLGVRRPEPYERIQEFKFHISELLIGLLFVLLAASLRLEDFVRFGSTGALLVGAVILLVRPLTVLVSTSGEKLSVRDRVFLSWVAPRGIVAASMASLFALRLANAGSPNAWFLESFTYSVIAATVLLQGFSAGFVARLLGVRRPDPNGWLIVGANSLGREIARWVRDAAKVPVILLDTNPRAAAEARAEGLPVLQEDVLTPGLAEQEPLAPVGYVLALTDNEDLNALVCEHWAKVTGRSHVFRWSSAKRAAGAGSSLTGQIVFGGLPKPSLVAAELMSAEAVTNAIRAEDLSGVDSTAILLGSAKEGSVELYPQAPETPPKTGTLLCLRRPKSRLGRFVHPALLFRIEGKPTKEELLGALMDRVVAEFPRVAREATVREILEREKAFPTVIGHGVAVPHAYCPALQKPVVAVAQAPGGIEFSGGGGGTVNLVFLVLSPPGDPRQHLALLARIAEICSRGELRESLKRAPVPEELFALLLAE